MSDATGPEAVILLRGEQARDSALLCLVGMSAIKCVGPAGFGRPIDIGPLRETIANVMKLLMPKGMILVVRGQLEALRGTRGIDQAMLDALISHLEKEEGEVREQEALVRRLYGLQGECPL